MKQVILRKKLNNKAGFSLTEMLVTILLMTIVLSAVTGGIEAARRAYQSVRLKADAQMLLATTITEVSTEFERAKDVKVDASNKNSISGFYSERRGGDVEFQNTGWISDSDTDNGKVGILITNLYDDGSKPYVALVTDDTRGADTLYTKFVKANDDDTKDPGVPYFVEDDGTEKTGYIQYTIKVYNHKASSAADGSDDMPLAKQTVSVRPVLWP